MRSFRTIALLALPLSALALTAPALADVKDGVDAWQAGDFQKAVAEWRPLAVAGDPDAQFNLGQAYKLGRGVAADLAQAESWYRRAAKQGHLQAEDNLGLILFTANKRDEAMPYINASANRGEPRAQYVLGTAMFNGDFAGQDWPRAYALTKRASDAGLEIASARLAQLDRLIPLEQRQKGLAMLPQMEKDEARARLAAVNAVAPVPVRPLPSPIKTASLPASTPGTRYAPPPVITPPTPAPAPAPAPASTPAPVLAKPSTPVAVAAASAASEAAAAADAATAAAAVPQMAAAPGTSYAAPPESGKLPPAAKPAPVAAKPIRVATVDAKPAPAKPAPTKPAAIKAVAVQKDAGPWRAQLGAFGVEANARNLWAALERKHPVVASREPILVKAGALTRLQAGGFASKADAESFCATVRKSGQACMVMAK
ncbi:SPOR domain-containing protein [Sphingopyxis sp.]|uniref:SPOR domain-containing protein n=1 Tax=Sphingopyxis sp. TaxID=1908224 RepID=UPI003BAD87E9